jgi:hypothetical protein
VRRLLVGLVGLLVVLGAADRISELVAARAVARHVRAAEHLGRDPAVSFAGFPFLTQALRGRFSEVDLTATDIRPQGISLARVKARLRGVHAGVGEALAGKLTSASIDDAAGSVLIRYQDLGPLLTSTLNGAIPGGTVNAVTLRDVGGRLAISGQAQVGGQGVPVEVDCDVSVRGSTIRVIPRLARLPLVGDQTLSGADQAQLAVTIPADQLPFGIHLRTVAVLSDGLRVDGDSAAFP